jgi:hypothetical protein
VPKHLISYSQKNRHLNLSSLYKYLDICRFFHGFNIRAFVAFICGIAPNLAGLAKATGNRDVPKVATYIYSLSWLVGTAVAFGTYTVAGKIRPMEKKFEAGQVMDGLDASSFSHSDKTMRSCRRRRQQRPSRATNHTKSRPLNGSLNLVISLIKCLIYLYSSAVLTERSEVDEQQQCPSRTLP